MATPLSIQPPILRHASWIVVNSIQGCPKSCAYCFLTPIGQTGVAPQEVCSPSEAIRLLVQNKHYTPETPICFFTSTDPFATPFVEQKLKEALDEFIRAELKNPVCFVTKCCPSKAIIPTLEKMMAQSIPVIPYISYSGLNNKIERGVIAEKNRAAFPFFKDIGLPVIHYWRPLLPQNSTLDVLTAVGEYVSQYAKASVITGLKLYKEMQEQIPFWPQVQERMDEAVKAECVWPKNALEKTYEIAARLGLPVYQSNSCALNYVLGREDKNAFWGSNVCTDHNKCPPFQREKCRAFYAKRNINKADVINFLARLKIDADERNVDVSHDQTPVVRLTGLKVDTAAIATLREQLNAVIETKFDRGYYWGASIAGEKPFVVEDD
ncbi:MAG: hypothetical protein HND56_11960 [Pseudomonadota bacterium]|nr:MAG: hypothetical protein HND56_11960 [Pseudomonadota bacterium]